MDLINTPGGIIFVPTRLPNSIVNTQPSNEDEYNDDDIGLVVENQPIMFSAIFFQYCMLSCFEHNTPALTPPLRYSAPLDKTIFALQSVAAFEMSRNWKVHNANRKVFDTV
jgi:hypothetical protein